MEIFGPTVKSRLAGNLFFICGFKRHKGARLVSFTTTLADSESGEE